MDHMSMKDRENLVCAVERMRARAAEALATASQFKDWVKVRRCAVALAKGPVLPSTHPADVLAAVGALAEALPESAREMFDALAPDPTPTPERVERVIRSHIETRLDAALSDLRDAMSGVESACEDAISSADWECIAQDLFA